MESNVVKFKVMLINSVLTTTLIPLYVRYKWYAYSVRWICHVLETEKILASTDNQITVIITMYRECYDTKRDERILLLSFIIIFF